MTRAGDLEVLPVPSSLPALATLPVARTPATTGDLAALETSHRSRPAQRRRWLVIVLAAVVVVFVVAVPVRTAVAKSEFQWLAGRIARYQALEDARQEAVQAVSDAAFPGDEALVADATFALSLEEATRLHQLDHSVAGALLVDGKLAELRRAFRQLLTARQLGLQGSIALPPPIDAPARRVDDLLAAEEHRFGTGPPRPVPAIRLDAADGTLASLHRWLDRPTGAQLLALGADGVFRLDVDASQAQQLTSSRILDGALIPRLGYLALFSNGEIFAEPTDFHAPARLIGRGDQAFAADRPDAIWVLKSNTIGEVDGEGRWLVPPVAYQGFVASISVGRGIALHTQTEGLIVWDPGSGRTVCSLGVAGEAIAGSGDLLAWVEPKGGLHLTDVSSCQTRTVDRPDSATYLGFLGAAGAISPDGRTVAAYVALRTGRLGEAFRLALVDVASGRVTVPRAPDRSARVEPIIWTADSQRVFFTISTSGGASLPATYQLGQAASTPLRYRASPGFSVLAVLPSATPGG